MRDPKRIDEMLSTISEIWHKYPDLRLCQLLGNCFPAGGDLYYIEDDIVLENLKVVYGLKEGEGE